MTGGHLAEAGVFLISTLFGLYILIILLRFLLQTVRADFYNPISQLLVTLTSPPLRWLRRWIPGYGGIDWSCIVLLLALQSLEIVLVGLVGSGRIPALPGLAVISIANLLELTVYTFMFAIIIQVVISWVNPGAYNPVTVILYKLTEPLLRPARRMLPPVSGLDFSPLVVLIGLQLAVILLVKPLLALGYSLSGYGI